MYVVIKVWKYLTFQRYKFITLIALYTQEILQKKIQGCFSTQKNLQMKNDDTMLYYLLWPKMSSWILDLAHKLF